MLNLGSELSFGKVQKVASQQQQQNMKKDILCIFCKKPFSEFRLCSDHMLRVHHQEIAQKVRKLYIFLFFLTCLQIEEHYHILMSQSYITYLKVLSSGTATEKEEIASAYANKVNDTVSKFYHVPYK